MKRGHVMEDHREKADQHRDPERDRSGTLQASRPPDSDLYGDFDEKAEFEFEQVTVHFDEGNGRRVANDTDDGGPLQQVADDTDDGEPLAPDDTDDGAKPRPADNDTDDGGPLQRVAPDDTDDGAKRSGH
jgi:hypothetical protein